MFWKGKNTMMKMKSMIVALAMLFVLTNAAARSRRQGEILTFRDAAFGGEIGKQKVKSGITSLGRLGHKMFTDDTMKMLRMQNRYFYLGQPRNPLRREAGEVRLYYGEGRWNKQIAFAGFAHPQKLYFCTQEGLTDYPKQWPKLNFPEEWKQQVSTQMSITNIRDRKKDGEIRLGVCEPHKKNKWIFTFKSFTYMMEWLKHLQIQEANFDSYLLGFLHTAPPIKSEVTRPRQGSMLAKEVAKEVHVRPTMFTRARANCFLARNPRFQPHLPAPSATSKHRGKLAKIRGKLPKAKLSEDASRKLDFLISRTTNPAEVQHARQRSKSDTSAGVKPFVDSRSRFKSMGKRTFAQIKLKPEIQLGSTVEEIDGQFFDAVDLSR